MKKTILISALLAVSVVLAGCQPAEDGEGTPGALETPMEGSPIAETPFAETPLAETPLAETPLAETPLAETPAAETPAATETEGAIPPTGEEMVPDLSTDIFEEYSVQLADGTEVGSLVDLVLDLNQGRVVYLVISLEPEAGGETTTGSPTPATEGQGQQAVSQGTPVPWDLVSLDEQQRTITLDIDQEQLQGAPTVDLNTWPDPSDPDWDAEIRSYWGTEVGDTE